MILTPVVKLSLPLLDSLSLKFAVTLEEAQAWQEKGRVGRKPDAFGRGIIFTPRSIIKTAEKYLECKFYPFCRCTSGLLIYFSFHRSDSDKQSFKNKQDPCILDKSKALVITEKSCYTVPFTSTSSSIVPGISMIGFNFLKDLTIRTLLSIEVEIMMEYEWNLRR